MSDNINVKISAVSFESKDGPFSFLKNIFSRSKGELIAASDKHYEKAADLIASAKKEIILCQRTSTFLLAPEIGRPHEVAFSRNLDSKLKLDIPIYHMIHEESCLSDIWRFPQKFRLELGHFPIGNKLFTGRYLSDKPVPRLLIVDQRTIGVVFDIDQMQFYAVVETPQVGQAAEYIKRYITDKGQDGFSFQRFYEQLRKARETVEEIQKDFDTSDQDVFKNVFLKRLRNSRYEKPTIDFAVTSSDGGTMVNIPMAWPSKKIGVFYDSPLISGQEFARRRIWSQMNRASSVGWQCLFFSRTELLSGIDNPIQTICNAIENDTSALPAGMHGPRKALYQRSH